MKTKQIIGIIVLILVVCILGFLVYGYVGKLAYKVKNPVVSMEIKGYGTVKIELYPEMAPNTVKNFIKLANDGYYNGLTFYEVEENLVRGGQKVETEEVLDKAIVGEFKANKYEENTLKFDAGVIGLNRNDYSGYVSYLGSDVVEKGYNSGYAEFFIAVKSLSSFNNFYTPFGKVIEGMDIIEKISALKTTKEKDQNTGKKVATTTPKKPPVINSIEVETFGVEYKAPDLIEAYNVNKAFSERFNVGQ